MSSSPPTSTSVIRYSTFTDTATVNNAGTAARDVGFWNSAVIVAGRVHAGSSTEFSAAIYSSSDKKVSTFVTSYSVIDRQFMDTNTGTGGQILPYRDDDSTSKIHWLAANASSYTSTVTMVFFYESG